jgi:hypothetical protein
VAAGPGRNRAGRDGDVQDRRWPDPSGSGQAPPEDRRFDASKCQPRTSPRSGTLAR